MAEHPSNVVAVHAHCAPRPISVDQPLALLVGRFVKKGFPCAGAPTREHMWVKVTGVEGDRLVGTLDNDPVGRCGVRRGDRVFVARREVEGVL